MSIPFLKKLFSIYTIKCKKSSPFLTLVILHKNNHSFISNLILDGIYIYVLELACKLCKRFYAFKITFTLFFEYILVLFTEWHAINVWLTKERIGA